MAKHHIPYSVANKTLYTVDVGGGKKAIKINTDPSNNDCCCGCHAPSSCPDPYVSCICTDGGFHGAPESFQTIRVVLSGVASGCNCDYRSRGSIFWADSYAKITDPNITFDLTIRPDNSVNYPFANHFPDGPCQFFGCGWVWEDFTGGGLTLTNHAMDGYNVVGTCVNPDPYPGHSCDQVIYVVGTLCYITSGIDAGQWFLSVTYTTNSQDEDDTIPVPGCINGQSFFFGRFRDEEICCGKPFVIPNEATYDNGYEPGAFGFPVHHSAPFGGSATLTFCP